MIEFSRLAHLLWAILRHWLSVCHSVYSSKDIILRVMPYSGLLDCNVSQTFQEEVRVTYSFQKLSSSLRKTPDPKLKHWFKLNLTCNTQPMMGKCWISSTKTKPELIIFFSFWKKKIGGCKIETGNRILFSPQSTDSECCNKTGLEGKNNTFLEQ